MFFSQFKCCAVTGYTQWLDKRQRIPKSCCRHVNETRCLSFIGDVSQHMDVKRNCDHPGNIDNVCPIYTKVRRTFRGTALDAGEIKQPFVILGLLAANGGVRQEQHRLCWSDWFRRPCIPGTAIFSTFRPFKKMFFHQRRIPTVVCFFNSFKFCSKL